MDRVAFYIDGYNLYHSLEKGFYDLLWLDLERFANESMRESDCSIDTEIAFIKFFTARWKGKPESDEHHQNYFKALKATSGDLIKQYIGKFNRVEEKCPVCHNTIYKQKEKHSDVNLALHMLMDAVNNEYDIAFLVSGDADFVPAIRMIKEEFEDIKIFVLFPPGLLNGEISAIVDYSLEITDKLLSKCQLPNNFTSDGITYSKPVEWSRSYRKI